MNANGADARKQQFRDAFNAAPDQEPAGVIVKRASTIRIEPHDWLWKHWLARKKLHILAGQGGVGKSTVALKMVATLSRGATWPDGTEAPCCDSVIWSGEDGVGDTILPRLLAMNADMDRVHIIQHTVDEKGPRPFNPATDISKLGRALGDILDPGLVLLDPVSAAFVGDSHKDAEVRASFQPLFNLAEAHNSALLGITHFAKNSVGRLPLERIMGSAAIGNAPRLAMVAVKADEESKPRILARAKSNIGPDGGGFEYTLLQTLISDGETSTPAQYAEFGQFLNGSARKLLAVEEPTSDAKLRQREAADFLLEILADETKKVADVRKAAEAHGHSWRTIERAKKDVGVKATHPDPKGPWLWSLEDGPAGRQPD